MTQIAICSPKAFEPWHAGSPDDPGIGGSETMHCELAWRLAARGHAVTSYAPVPPDVRDTWHRGVFWRHLDEVIRDECQPGLWIFVRGIECLSEFPRHDRQRVWCVFQDVDLLEPWQASWLPKVDRILGLCDTHCTYLKHQHPEAAAKVYQSRNGLRGDVVDEVLRETPPVRNPHRLMYASSPDRGLHGLLQAFRLIRFLVADAELHVFYGFDNMLSMKQRAVIQRKRDALTSLADYPGVHLRGRMGQPELYREWLQTGLMCAPTNFLETGYITLMEAQALGAIPIINPIWAASEQQLAGIAIEGDGEQDPLALRRYAMAAVYLMQQPQLQDEIRGPMMAEARKRYDWAGVVDQYERFMQEDGL